jgi:hypothetical protein
MHFKNYKSFEFYILLNLIHLISMPTTSLQFIMHRGIGISHPFLISLPLLLASSDAPNSGACADPTTIAAARTRAWTPSPTAAARTPPRQRVPPLTFPSIFLLHAWPQHIRICATNEARQSTHRGSIHFYHLPHKQARHIGNMHIPPACKAQANKCQKCTYTCTHTDSSCMHAN